MHIVFCFQVELILNNTVDREDIQNIVKSVQIDILVSIHTGITFTPDFT